MQSYCRTKFAAIIVEQCLVRLIPLRTRSKGWLISPASQRCPARSSSCRNKSQRYFCLLFLLGRFRKSITWDGFLFVRLFWEPDTCPVLFQLSQKVKDIQHDKKELYHENIVVSFGLCPLIQQPHLVDEMAGACKRGPRLSHSTTLHQHALLSLFRCRRSSEDYGTSK